MKKTSLSIVGEEGPQALQQFKMVDVSGKRITARRAVAAGSITVGADAWRKISERALPKGDALALAEIAGILGAKKTPELLAMCHALPLDQVGVHCVLEAPDKVTVYAQVSAVARTGVEMEALMAVQTALAAIWDLTKAANPALCINDVRLLVKEGGKEGLWLNPDGIPDWLLAQLPEQKPLADVTAAIVVLSDRAFEGVYEDKSGLVAADTLKKAGARITSHIVLPDNIEKITAHLTALMNKEKPQLIIACGGTGLTPRDVTPEAIAQVCARMVPGFGEMLRQNSAPITQNAYLSRATAGVLKGALVVAIPGSPKATGECMEALLPVLPHALLMIADNNHD